MAFLLVVGAWVNAANAPFFFAGVAQGKIRVWDAPGQGYACVRSDGFSDRELRVTRVIRSTMEMYDLNPSKMNS